MGYDKKRSVLLEIVAVLCRSCAKIYAGEVG